MSLLRWLTEPCQRQLRSFDVLAPHMERGQHTTSHEFAHQIPFFCTEDKLSTHILAPSRGSDLLADDFEASFLFAAVFQAGVRSSEVHILDV